MRPARTVLTCAINSGLRVIGTLPTCILGNAYSATISAFGGSGTGYKFTPDPAESLPSGLTFTDNLDGTATVAGTTSVPGNVHVFGVLRDSNRDRVPYSFNFLVQPLPLVVTGDIGDAVAGTAASGGYTITGGVSPYTVTVISGTSPFTGDFDNTGAAQGVRRAVGHYAWTVRVDDSDGASTDISDSCDNTYSTLTLTGTDYGTPYFGEAFSQNTLTIAGGSGIYSNPRASSGGPVPAGLALSIVGSTLVLSGTATAVRSAASITWAVDSSDGQTATYTQTFSVVYDPVAVSIYGKIANAAGGSGMYFDLHEASGSRLDQANATLTLSVGGTDATADGPRGTGDVAFDCGNRAAFLNAGTLAANAQAANDFSVFGWGYAISNPAGGDAYMLATFYGGGSTATEGYYIYQFGDGNVYGECGNSGGGPSNFAAKSGLPSTNTWHFYHAWRDPADGHMRVSIDNGTPAVSSSTAAPPTSVSGAFMIGLLSTTSYKWAGRVSRVGVSSGGHLSTTEITWLMNSGNGRDWSEIKYLAGH